MSDLMQSVNDSLAVFRQMPEWEKRAATEFIAGVLQPKLAQSVKPEPANEPDVDCQHGAE